MTKDNEMNSFMERFGELQTNPRKAFERMFAEAEGRKVEPDDSHDCHLTPFGEDGCDCPIHNTHGEKENAEE
jgi:hypothetical protein